MSRVEKFVEGASRIAVETFLLEHRDVIAASLLAEQTVDGRSFTIAYVVPDPERLREGKARIYRTEKEKRVSQWRMAFDLAYRSRVRDPSPSFAGWTSSYTNKPLPETEMQEWLAVTADRIASFHPEHVFEIGCGVGLLVQALAPRYASYAGSDLSPIAIACLRDFVASKPELRHVALFEREAADLRDQPACSVDTVIINSVVQYFPDIAYLRNVIGEAARLVRPGGRIFIGDVRHCGLLPLFHSAVQLAKAPANASAGSLKRTISIALEQERELAIDPEFFFELAEFDRDIHSVEVLLRRGKAHNELTRYRYDVILHIGEAKPLATGPQVEWQAGEHSIAEVISLLEAQEFTSAIIKNVPNRRLASDIAGMRRLWSADDRQFAGMIRESVSADADFGSDPEDFWALADDGLCDVRISWTPRSADGNFDVALIALDRAGCAFSRAPEVSLGSATPQRLATDPLDAAYRQQLGLELRQILGERLPEISVPAVVFAVNSLPRI